MKRLLIVSFITLTFLACKKEAPKDYVTISGTITDQNSDSLVITSKGYKKLITVNPDGTFNDTLMVKQGTYYAYDGKKGAPLYLKNGYDLGLNVNAKDFGKSIVFTGKGNEASNYFIKSDALRRKLYSNQKLYDLERSDFNEEVKTVLRSMTSLLETTKNLDSAFVAEQKASKTKFEDYLITNYEDKQYLKTVLARGKASPKFNDYENYTGETASLDDFKGKFLYLDIWATWCGPCVREIPYLKALEKKYHGKNIEFVSISIDKHTSREKWKTMIKNKELGGVQLLADNDWSSKFVQDYKIKGIPRFILIDPDGNIVSADAPRPSNKKLIDLFSELNI